MPIWLIVLLSVIILPFLEELIFRHPLRFKTNIVLKLMVWFSGLFGREARLKTRSGLNGFWNRRFGILFYSSAILFGLAHLTNYDLDKIAFYLFPVLIVVQFFFGLFAGYLRVRYSFFLGFCLHASHNAILILIPLIFIGTSTEILAHKNQDYSLEIERVNFGAGNSSIRYGDDTLSFENVGLKNIISQLSGKRKILINSNDAVKLGSSINLTFIDYRDKMIKDRNDTILKYLSHALKFSTKIRVKKQGIYWLEIMDSTKLKINRSGSNSAEINTFENKMEMENVSLATLAGTITARLDKLTLCDTIDERFDFKLPLETDELCQILEKKIRT